MCASHAQGRPLDPGWKQFLSSLYQSFYQSHKPSELSTRHWEFYHQGKHRERLLPPRRADRREVNCKSLLVPNPIDWASINLERFLGRRCRRAAAASIVEMLARRLSSIADAKGRKEADSERRYKFQTATLSSRALLSVAQNEVTKKRML